MELKVKTDSEIYSEIQNAKKESDNLLITHLVDGEKIGTTLEIGVDDYGFTDHYFYIEQGEEGTDGFSRVEISYSDFISVEPI